MRPPFITLPLATVFEVFVTSYLLKTNQFTASIPTLMVLVDYGLAFYLLSIAEQSMSVDMAYAI